MKKKKYTGIQVKPQIRFQYRKKDLNSDKVYALLCFLFQCISTAFTAVGIMQMMTQPLGFVNNLGVLIAAAVISVLIFAVLLLRKVPLYIMTGVLIVSGWLGWWQFQEELTEEIPFYLNRVGQLIAAYYYDYTKYPEWSGSFSLSVQVIVLIAMVFWLSLFYFAFKKIWLALLPGYLVIVGGLLIGVTGGRQGLIFFLIGWLGMVLMKEEKVSFRLMKKPILSGALITAALVILAWGAQWQIVRRQPVPTESQRKVMRSQIENFFTREDGFFRRKQAWAGDGDGEMTFQGGVSGGDLTNVGDLSYSGYTQVEVEVDVKPEETVYLRGYAGDYYTGINWIYGGDNTFDTWYLFDLLELEIEEIEEEAVVESWGEELQSGDYSMSVYVNGIEVSPDTEGTVVYNVSNESIVELLSLPYYALEQQTKAKMSIHVFDDIGGYELIPYGALIPEDRTVTADSFILQKKEEYQYRYIKDIYSLNLQPDNISDDLAAGDYQETEEKYREYVYDTNLNVMPGLKRFHEAYSETSKFDTLEETIEYVQSELWSKAVYTLSPGETPDDQEFVEYFLFENQKGYCVHFATAGVLLFRQLGIPARYAEGYVITPKNFQKNDEGLFKAKVKDYQAHAWVEIYIDGLGWIPVEVTPGYEEGSITAAEDMGLTPEEEKPDETVTEVKKQQTKKNTAQEKREKSSLLQNIMIILAVLASVVLAVTGRALYRQRKREAGIRQEDKNKGVCSIFEQTEILLAFAGTSLAEYKETDENGKWLFDLAYRAAYSTDSIDKSEFRKACRIYGDIRRKTLAGMGKRQRFTVKFLKCC